MKKIYLTLVLLISFTAISFGQTIDESDISRCVRIYKLNYTTGESEEVTSYSVPFSEEHEYFLQFDSEHLYYEYSHDCNNWLFEWSVRIPYQIAGQDVQYYNIRESGYGLINTSCFPMNESLSNYTPIGVTLTVSGMGIKNFGVFINKTWYFYHQK